MAGLISATEAPSIRDALNLFLVHTCTFTPITDGSVDSENVPASTPGSAVTGVACKYRASDRVRLDEGGTTTVLTPTLKVAHDSVVATGGLISNVQNSTGVVLLAGPVTVGSRTNSDGLGPTLSKRFVLRGADPGRAV